MKLTVIGLSHHTAPVSLRERFALRTGSSTSEASTATELEETLDALRGLEGVSEACVISTCNRVEYYST
ncbi:MAG: hypothetical protein AAFU79_19465, partial [Myxococcota bacterium]